MESTLFFIAGISLGWNTILKAKLVHNILYYIVYDTIQGRTAGEGSDCIVLKP